MPVQINEMVIRAHVRESGDQLKQAVPGAGGAHPDKNELIRECTEAILELLNRKNER